MTGAAGGLELFAAGLTGVAAASAVAWAAPPPRRLETRLERRRGGAGLGRGPAALIADLLGWSADRDRAGREDDAVTLRRAGLRDDLEAERARRAGWAAAGALAGAGLALAADAGLASSAVGAVVGGIGGLAQSRASLERRIARRDACLRAELPTVCHLLAVHLRAGGGVLAAMRRTAEACPGTVAANDLHEVLAAHDAGRPAGAALANAAERASEPGAARCYRMLAGALTHGADVTTGLRRLSAELRDVEREDARRRAAKRRAAMLVPIIAFMAPTMLLFIVAPIPSMVFGG